MIEDYGIQGTKESFLRRPKPWLRRRALLFAYPIERKQLLQVDALKFRATIDHQSGQQTPIPFHTQAQRHHTRAVGSRVKGEVVGGNSSRESKSEQG